MDLKYGMSYPLMLETLEMLNNFEEKLRAGFLKIVLAAYVLITFIMLGMPDSEILA